MHQKVVVVCRVKKPEKIYKRNRTKSSDLAGESIVLFKHSQAKHIRKKTKYMYGTVHKESENNISKSKKIPLSSCTYKNLMKVANTFMLNCKKGMFIGPAYISNNIITDFQTAVTGTVEEVDDFDPYKTAIRELKEEIGLRPNNLELIDTSNIYNKKIFTLIADY